MKSLTRSLGIGLALISLAGLTGCDSSNTATDFDPFTVFRAELEWDAVPDDLDAHLTGPDGSGGRFHVYFVDPIFGEHELMEDFTDGPGPEVVNIEPDGEEGVYRFSVHNFSDQSSTGGESMEAVDAEVRLYADGDLIRTFRAQNADDGNTWRVFEIEIDGDNVSIDPGSGSDGIGYFTADGTDDTDVFLTGGGNAPPANKVDS